jgi:hypothetical protein
MTDGSSTDNFLEQYTRANDKVDHLDNYLINNTSHIQSDAEFDNSDNKNLNKSEEYAEIMSKINKQAENIKDTDDIIIFDKYLSLSDTQILKEIKNKK